ncbi:MAG TPA: class I SAM-dependent methyltransferase [Kiritimatiellia bacterium]|jgi:2-polyprenyl-3-methyl-5-hydroxy-6-metoxy-1,4-benzoquinol methylase|nr:MAG: putative S-adenosylmethionine-dependent methyltransferase [Verrucomicrobia bacterium ADurb.Bin018]HOE00290.1 class I SAM-dependent methyltransferase [Kiritimatiellia bacterium]HOE36150.1 class I SAM-dependent methyltransferase [Kiritimatiellia bacterium]HOR73784.1 class I SAM-dependent methyltransferase [Kiritimatiellia bacterium]HOU58180.1 class I SAM-dependent methyltransferase [Kiritimatiellia bacterium]
MVERSHFFEDLAHAEDDPLAFRAEHEPCLARLRARLGDVRGRRIFEPGCGAGPLTVRLAEWVGGGGHVLALDASERMIARCAAAVAGLPQVTVRHGDITGYSAPAGSWDIVLVFRFYPHLPDPAAFLRECWDWLTPGGQLVVANLEGSRELNAMHAQLHAVQHDHMPTAVALQQQLAAAGWRVAEAIDVPDDYFVRAWRD